MRYFDFNTVAEWGEHWTNGGTGITKTNDADIIESVRLFNDPEIVMKDGAIHCMRHKIDISDFWKFHYDRIGEKL